MTSTITKTLEFDWQAFDKYTDEPFDLEVTASVEMENEKVLNIEIYKVLFKGTNTEALDYLSFFQQDLLFSLISSKALE